MKWPWQREPDGEEARAAEATAQQQLDDTRAQTRQVAAAERAARAAMRQTDRFARDVELALRLRGIT